jgi:soluble lytic murein transglycosylase-like protein
MSNAPSLVIRGTLVGCFLLALVGWFLAGQIELSPTGEVAYAASADAAENNSPAVDCQVSLNFPEEVRQWCSLITAKAIQAELPADLIAAVILQESGGDAGAYSKSGAVGLMQVMPRDGIAASFECINGPCFASRPTIAELQDPEFNIEYGSQMLAGLSASLGDWREALKAYGPMDVGYSYADWVLAIYDRYH